ncbi:MAG: ZIP family metal transporter [Clostridiales bacterium]|nr:ZIP family metal transporter [Clostridiales bacterium]
MHGLLWMSVLAGAATVLGGGLAFLLPEKRGALAFAFGLAAGVMLAVACADLWPSALKLGGSGAARAGLLAGVLLPVFCGSLLARKKGPSLLHTGVLVACGIALHDLPEGMAISAGFLAGGRLGPLLALAIGLHNLPEGLAVAAPLLAGGQKPGKTLLLLCGISLCTPLGAMLGLGLSGFPERILGGFLAFSAGAMLYVALKELLPLAWREERFFAVTGMLSGFLLLAAVSLLESF